MFDLSPPPIINDPTREQLETLNAWMREVYEALTNGLPNFPTVTSVAEPQEGDVRWDGVSLVRYDGSEWVSV